MERKISCCFIIHFGKTSFLVHISFCKVSFQQKTKKWFSSQTCVLLLLSFFAFFDQAFQIHLKGTVSRNLSSSLFFLKQLLLVPIDTSRDDFDFLKIFMELFIFVTDSPVMSTPGSRLESLGGTIFSNINHMYPRS